MIASLHAHMHAVHFSRRAPIWDFPYGSHDQLGCVYDVIVSTEKEVFVPDVSNRVSFFQHWEVLHEEGSPDSQ